MFKLNRKELPSFNIIKDLFDFIDLKKDGTLDIHEWMAAFRAVKVIPL